MMHPDFDTAPAFARPHAGGPSAFSRFAQQLIAITVAQDEDEVGRLAFAAAQALVGGDDIILCEIAVSGSMGPARRAVLSGGGAYGGLAGLCTACDGRNPLAQAIRSAMMGGGVQQVDGLRAHTLPVDAEHSLALAWVDAGSPSPELESGLALLLAQVRAAHERLRRAARPSRALAAAGLAHDVANLLQVIAAGADALSERCANDPEAQLLSADVLQAATRADRLLRELRTLGRPTEDAPPVELSAVLPTVLSDASLLLGGRKLLRPDALPEVQVPVSQTALERALLNLIKNAILAVPESGTIAVEATVVESMHHRALPGGANLPPGRWLALSVKDDGPGVDEALLSRLGAPFLTTRATIGGSGLGIAVTRSVVTAAGGALSIDSVAGAGFAATVWLPASGLPSPSSRGIWAIDGVELPADLVGEAQALSSAAALREALRPDGARPALIVCEDNVLVAFGARLAALCPAASLVHLAATNAADRARRLGAALDSYRLDVGVAG